MLTPPIGGFFYGQVVSISGWWWQYYFYVIPRLSVCAKILPQDDTTSLKLCGAGKNKFT